MRKALRRQFTRAAYWGSPPTKAGHRSGSGILDTRGQAQDGDARNVINAR
jgi:hypothetical protein